jgi:hypothetical protein
MKLYTYCLRYDGGAAPNPFWGTCTLVICKPAIRRTAQLGDWVVGLGSTNSLIGDISHYLVYAMKVTSKLTMKEYDQFCKISLPKKIPDQESPDYRLRNGDCIYDYGTGKYPKMRPAVHNECHRVHDLVGKFALLSKHFYYFGSQPIPLPEYLYPIIHAMQGHKSMQNQPYLELFVNWIENLGYKKNKIYAIPQYQLKRLTTCDFQRTCFTPHLQQKENKQTASSC